MLQRETAGKAAAAERVHCPAGRSHGRHLRKGYSRLCDGCYHKGADETELTWQAHATGVVLSAAAAARQVWHDDAIEPDQAGQAFREKRG